MTPRRSSSSRVGRGRSRAPASIARGVALAATLHDPEGALYDEIRRRLPLLRRLYASVHVTSSPPTHGRVRGLLAAAGVDAGAPRTNTRGPLYRLALRRALATRAAHVHYLDFDRALHWVVRRRRELAGVLAGAHRHAALVVGRTPRAHATHHAALVETEAVAERAFAARLGLRTRVDFLVPSFVLRRDLAARFLVRSHARGSTMYGEWVALLAGLGVPLAYVECEGLDWETPDRYPAEIRRIGRAAWRKAMSTPAEWTVRHAMARDFQTGLDRTLRRHPLRTPLELRRAKEGSG